MNDHSRITGASRRRGFTLIELLIVMSIMAILGAAMALAVSGAQESANIAKTRGLIDRLHVLVMQKYESYRTRRLPISIPAKVLDGPNGNPIVTPLGAVRTVRVDAIRQLMRMEMPERWTDLDDPAVITVADNTSGVATTYYDVNNPGQPAFVAMLPPSALQAYRGQATTIPHGGNPMTYNPSSADTSYEGAKCLYLLVTSGLEEQDVMENFSEGDIGDFDGSGHKVFLDAWGKPIGFLRWAPAFVSPLQPAKPSVAGQRDYRMQDQTDPTGVYGSPGNTNPNKHETFALYPLIYSAGPDGYVGMISKSGAVFHYVNTSNPRNNPFASLTDNSNFANGGTGTAAIFDDAGNFVSLGNAQISDNIHNHMIGAR